MRNLLSGIAVILGAVYILFLPGFVLSFLFFKRDKESVDIIERLALSFALSIAVIPLTSFYLNLVGIKVSRLSVFLEVLGIILLAIVGIWLKSKYKRKGKRYEISPRS